jgi:hypothetical protein
VSTFHHFARVKVHLGRVVVTPDCTVGIERRRLAPFSAQVRGTRGYREVRRVPKDGASIVVGSMKTSYIHL